MPDEILPPAEHEQLVDENLALPAEAACGSYRTRCERWTQPFGREAGVASMTRACRTGWLDVVEPPAVDLGRLGHQA